MALGRISGPMLRSNLERNGIDLSVETDLLYFDVNNNRIGINQGVPGESLSIVGNASITDASVDGSAFSIISTNSILLPAGSTGQRPATTVEGMFRYNSSEKNVEFFNGTIWTAPSATGGGGSTTADSFTGDGSTVVFTLSTETTSAGAVVSINGVVQDPGTSYTVTGTSLTFTEAPLLGDNIDVRIITTTSTTTAIQDLNTVIAVDDAGAIITNTIDGTDVLEINVTSVRPAADNTFTLGTASRRWSTVYAVNTTIQNADLAEYYLADQVIEPGSVVCFGGEFEVTESTSHMDTRVAGVISTNPAHIMNAGLHGNNVVAVALQGRVPCKVIGPVQKGDMMVSAPDGYAKAAFPPTIGSVIGKALENFDGDKGVIEVVVGRL